MEAAVLLRPDNDTAAHLLNSTTSKVPSLNESTLCLFATFLVYVHFTLSRDFQRSTSKLLAFAEGYSWDAAISRFLRCISSFAYHRQLPWSLHVLGHFGFVPAAEFTAPNVANFSSSLYLTVQDIAVDGVCLSKSRHRRLTPFPKSVT